MAVYAPGLAGQRLTADEYNTDIVAQTMEWTPLSSLGTFSGAFTASGSYPPRMQKLIVAGTEVWEFQGSIAISSWTANSAQSAFTFNTGYRPGHERGFHIYAASSAFYPVRMGIATNGVVTLGAPTAAGTGLTSVTLDGVRIVDPLS